MVELNPLVETLELPKIARTGNPGSGMKPRFSIESLKINESLVIALDPDPATADKQKGSFTSTVKRQARALDWNVVCRTFTHPRTGVPSFGAFRLEGTYPFRTRT